MKHYNNNNNNKSPHRIPETICKSSRTCDILKETHSIGVMSKLSYTKIVLSPILNFKITLRKNLEEIYEAMSYEIATHLTSSICSFSSI